MGTSFVTTDGEHGFWMQDSILELWLRLLALHIPEPAGAESPEIDVAAKRSRDQWLFASKYPFVGCVPHGLKDAVATNVGMVAVRSAVESLLHALEEAPSELNQDTLNLLGFSDRTHCENFETWRLIEVAYAFLGLLDGKIKATPESTVFMPGSRSESDLNQKLRGWPGNDF